MPRLETCRVSNPLPPLGCYCWFFPYMLALAVMALCCVSWPLLAVITLHGFCRLLWTSFGSLLWVWTRGICGLK